MPPSLPGTPGRVHVTQRSVVHSPVAPGIVSTGLDHSRQPPGAMSFELITSGAVHTSRPFDLEVHNSMKNDNV